ncbi:MAG: long-chain fatty acid--CoA ligase [Alphaproteobacteria bacterium]|nr:long-chain fatty acid--CoA ligase [Alphaproteobacteria bacterium]
MRASHKFVSNKIHQQWIGLSYSEVAQQTRDIASGLMARGVNRGDRVVLVSENRLEWVIADLAIMSIGAITVPAFTSNTEDDHLQILNDSGAVAIICTTTRLADIAEGAAERSPNCRLMVMVETSSTIHQPTGLAIISWAQLMKDGQSFPSDIDAAVEATAPTDTACVIYTSGSDSQPKGVMLSHRSILHNVYGAADRFNDLKFGDEVFLSLLPLSHAYEHTTGLYLPIYLGAEIFHLKSPDQLAQSLKEVRPTMMTTVPRLCDVLHDRIRANVASKGKLNQNLMGLALRLGRRKLAEGHLPPLASLINAMLSLVVRRRINQVFGGRLKLMVSGGAALSPSVGRFFVALGVRLVQGYGQTEAAPVISVSPITDNRIHTVGTPLKDVEVKLSKSGELLVRGDLVMKGYWDRPQETARVLKDGWLHTGDLAEIDDDMFITITGRKKDIIVNSGGENISPMRVESRLAAQTNIAQAMVHGDRRPWLAAVIAPSEECITKARGRPDKIITLIQNDIDTANARLPTSERIRRFVVADDGFTIENKRLTPTLKTRRHIINQQFRDKLDRLYSR